MTAPTPQPSQREATQILKTLSHVSDQKFGLKNFRSVAMSAFHSMFRQTLRSKSHPDVVNLLRVLVGFFEANQGDIPEQYEQLLDATVEWLDHQAADTHRQARDFFARV
jgi:hypothetical protein